jgi:hypothetical protein
MAENNVVPLRMTRAAALGMIRQLAEDSARIVIVSHGRKRQRERKITRPQIEFCLRKGFIDEGPFLNEHGNWQSTMCCQHAGDELTVVVAIDWPNQLIVITTY